MHMRRQNKKNNDPQKYAKTRTQTTPSSRGLLTSSFVPFGGSSCVTLQTNEKPAFRTLANQKPQILCRKRDKDLRTLYGPHLLLAFITCIGYYLIFKTSTALLIKNKFLKVFYSTLISILQEK